MKKFFILSAVLSAVAMNNVNAQTDAHGYTTVEASMGAGYTNRVFFDLSENQLTSQNANNWDIAFYRETPMDFGTRINDSKNIILYQVSSNPADFDAINISNIGSWGQPLYNPDNTESLFKGALEQTNINNACSNPAFTFSWGCYDIFSHKIVGKVSFVLKYPNNTYVKLFIDNYYGKEGYTFKYAKAGADGVWGETITKTISNGTSDKYFNYFSFENNSEVVDNEPNKSQWDFMLTRYWTFYNNVMMYRMSGIIQNPRISVAKATETQATSSINLPAETEFSKNITTIGHSWKPISGVHNNVVYYIKDGEKYYRLYFTENGGQATGNMYFKYKDITEVLSTKNINAKVSFGMYPNPAPNKQITILYDVKSEAENKGTI